MQLEGDQRPNEHLEANKWWIMSSIQLQPCCAHWRSPSQPQPKDLPSVLLVVFFKECLHWIFRWEKDKTALFNCSCWKNSFQFMNPSIQPFIFFHGSCTWGCRVHKRQPVARDRTSAALLVLATVQCRGVSCVYCHRLDRTYHWGHRGYDLCSFFPPKIK